MSTAEMKEVVLRQLEEADEKLLRMIHAMIEAYQTEDDPVISYDVHGNPRRASELQAILDKEVGEARKGNYISIDELDEKSKEWVKPTK
ncbi:MAG: hypothetical protein KTR30_13150 [Saprospiraceae bacterium]|nr:hypothetical protein [Saprospiraceae bacterium]